MHEVLNRLGGLSLPRKSVVRLTDHPDMTLDVYHGGKTTSVHLSETTEQRGESGVGAITAPTVISAERGVGGYYRTNSHFCREWGRRYYPTNNHFCRKWGGSCYCTNSYFCREEGMGYYPTNTHFCREGGRGYYRNKSFLQRVG